MQDVDKRIQDIAAYECGGVPNSSTLYDTGITRKFIVITLKVEQDGVSLE